MIVRPNVKLNIGLNVIRKREDGFHDLETLFVPYEGICDELEIETSGSFSIDIIREGGLGWDPMDDLTVKAYGLLRKDFALPPVRIRLVKNAPVGAGLGGGSSDAAFTLKCLDSIFGLELGDARLAEYAAKLGSDCAFFIYNRPMIGSGRGEILKPFRNDVLGGYRIEVTVPEDIAVSTADAYRGIVPHEPEIPLIEILATEPESWKGRLVNDFETTVFAKYPKLAQLKADFYEKGAVYASMSGSGSSIYGIFRGQ